jgi:hypothetical protein
MKLDNKWIVGFVDGDGCFKVIETKQGNRYCFVVSQDKRSIDVLYALKEKFGCGFVNRAGGNMFEYRVANQEHLKNIILPFFEKNPLHTSKIQDFKILYEALMGVQPNVTVQPICRDWLIGFIDAEANFYVSMVKNYPRPQFSIGLHQKDAQVLNDIQSFIKCGVVYIKRPRTSKAYSTYQISSAPAFESIIKTCTTKTNRCLLKTTKRISFLKFRKIVSIIQQRKHTTPEGIDMINKIRDSIR